jgi:hypothetical protein
MKIRSHSRKLSNSDRVEKKKNKCNKTFTFFCYLMHSDKLLRPLLWPIMNKSGREKRESWYKWKQFYNNKYFKLTVMNPPIPKITTKCLLKLVYLLIRKNSHEVIRVITNHYTKCSKWPPLLSIQQWRPQRNNSSTLSSIPVIANCGSIFLHAWNHTSPYANTYINVFTIRIRK